jgi:hypothetical protein
MPPSIRFALVLLGLAALLPQTLRAQSAPQNLRPLRDVSITYEVQSDGQATRRVPLAWQAATQRVRAEPEGLPGWVLLDLPQSQAQMVLEGQGMVVQVPARELSALLGGIPPGTRVAAAGSATVAGHRCANWRVVRSDGEGTVCLTADGVLLRAEGRHRGRNGRIEAKSVTYAAQDPARFVVPAGYTPVTLPPALLQGLLR